MAIILAETTQNISLTSQELNGFSHSDGALIDGTTSDRADQIWLFSINRLQSSDVGHGRYSSRRNYGKPHFGKPYEIVKRLLIDALHHAIVCDVCVDHGRKWNSNKSLSELRDGDLRNFQPSVRRNHRITSIKPESQAMRTLRDTAANSAR